MRDLFILRRANGDCLAERINGKLRIPVWSSELGVARYKARNPELMIYIPARLDRPLVEKIVGAPGGEASAEFWLLSETSPDADLEDGRPVVPEKIFSEG